MAWGASVLKIWEEEVDGFGRDLEKRVPTERVTRGRKLDSG